MVDKLHALVIEPRPKLCALLHPLRAELDKSVVFACAIASLGAHIHILEQVQRTHHTNWMRMQHAYRSLKKWPSAHIRLFWPFVAARCECTQYEHVLEASNSFFLAYLTTMHFRIIQINRVGAAGGRGTLG